MGSVSFRPSRPASADGGAPRARTLLDEQVELAIVACNATPDSRRAAGNLRPRLWGHRSDCAPVTLLVEAPTLGLNGIESRLVPSVTDDECSRSAKSASLTPVHCNCGVEAERNVRSTALNRPNASVRVENRAAALAPQARR